MKEFYNMKGFKENYSHLWNGSIYTHNVGDKSYIREHSALIDNYLRDLNTETIAEYNKAVKKLAADFRKNYSHADRKKYNEGVKKYNEDLKNIQMGFINLNNYHMMTIDETKMMFNTLMIAVNNIAKSHKIEFPGFRFAINGGRSVNTRSISVNTFPLITMHRSSNIKKNLTKCLRSFAHYTCWMGKGNGMTKEEICEEALSFLN